MLCKMTLRKVVKPLKFSLLIEEVLIKLRALIIAVQFTVTMSTSHAANVSVSNGARKVNTSIEPTLNLLS